VIAEASAGQRSQAGLTDRPTPSKGPHDRPHRHCRRQHYNGLDPRTATNAELHSRAADIDAAWDDLVGEAEDWANADDNALTAAYDDLYYVQRHVRRIGVRRGIAPTDN
jgi:hypothetical protein